MGFLNTFFNVGKYSDKEIAEAAGLYYGLGPIDSASVSASAAKAEANVTVNVNIGEATTTGSKQYVPERAHDGEYHVIYKNKDDTSPASKTSGGGSKKAEAKPESKAEANPEPQKQEQVSKPEANPEPQKPKAEAKSEKTAEKAAQPQPKQEKAGQTPAKTSDLKKLEDAKDEPVILSSSVSKDTNKKAETPKPKAEAKSEKTVEKAAQPQPKQDNADQAGKAVPVEVTDQQAAHALNNGFDYTHFQNSQTQLPIVAQPIPTPIQQSQPPMPVMPVAAPVPIYPANYRELTPEQRCDHLVSVINRGFLPPMNNPRPGLSAERKLIELKNHITFMEMPGRQIGQVRIDSLLNMLSSPSLKNAMNKYDSVDRANNPKLTEVPVNKYATGDQLIRFDMAFEAKLKDPKRVLVALYSTVPSYDPLQNAWSGDLCIFTKEQ